jgi:hypothetical protein
MPTAQLQKQKSLPASFSFDFSFGKTLMFCGFPRRNNEEQAARNASCGTLIPHPDNTD